MQKFGPPSLCFYRFYFVCVCVAILVHLLAHRNRNWKNDTSTENWPFNKIVNPNKIYKKVHIDCPSIAWKQNDLKSDVQAKRSTINYKNLFVKFFYYNLSPVDCNSSKGYDYDIWQSMYSTYIHRIGRLKNVNTWFTNCRYQSQLVFVLYICNDAPQKWLDFNFDIVICFLLLWPIILTWKW
jgi:hypothetical protein